MKEAPAPPPFSSGDAADVPQRVGGVRVGRLLAHLVLCGRRRVNTATLEPWQRRNGVFEVKLEYEVHAKFHEHEEDKKGVDTTAWVALEDLRPVYDRSIALRRSLRGRHLTRSMTRRWRAERA